MFKCRAGVIGRINKNAFYLSGIERQQGLKRVQIVALDQHVAGVAVTVAEIGDFLQQSIRHRTGCMEIVIARKPLQGGHI